LPVVGDAADVVNRANRRNYRLLEDAVARNRHVDVSAHTYLGLALGLLVVSVLIAVALAVAIVWAVVAGLLGLAR